MKYTLQSSATSPIPFDPINLASMFVLSVSPLWFDLCS